jgi:hypothetical protein
MQLYDGLTAIKRNPGVRAYLCNRWSTTSTLSYLSRTYARFQDATCVQLMLLRPFILRK